MIEITYGGRHERQPCHFGEYGQIVFWSESYQTNEIAQQLYAQMMGWA